MLIYRFIGLLAQAGADLSVYRFIAFLAQAGADLSVYRFIGLSAQAGADLSVYRFIGLSAQAGADLSVYRFIGLSAQAGKNRPCHHAGEVDRESTIGGCSSQASCSTTSSDEDSDISEPARSEVSVQDSIMEHAYHSLQNAFSVQEGQLVGGDGTLNQLELLPFHWPLAKLTLPLKFGVNRLEGLVVGFLMELMATRSQPWLCRRQISSFAKTLTVRVATYLAKEIASLFRPVLQHPVMALTDDDTLSLLTSDFWIRPVYEELLYAASRFNRSSGAEHKRPTSNLVKIASFSKDKSSDMMNAGIHHTTMTEWIGADCPVDFLNVWFPAHWAPIVLRELHRREDAYRKAHNLWFDDPHGSDPPRVKEQRKDALRSRKLQFQIGAMDNRKNLPTFIGTWYGCRAEKAQVTVLLPGQCDCSR